MPTENINIPYPPSYFVISKADFATLAGANGLTPGHHYLVTGAYSSALFGDVWNILVVADSVSTFDINFCFTDGGPRPFGTQVISDDQNFSTVTLVTPTIDFSMAAPQVLAFGSGVMKAGVTCYINGSLGTTVTLKTNVSDDGSQVCYDNVVELAGGVSIGRVGSYDPSTNTFTPYYSYAHLALTITGLSSIMIDEYHGIYDLGSVNSTEAIDEITSGPAFDFSFRPVGGLTITLTGTALATISADGAILLPTASVVLRGDYQESVTLRRVNITNVNGTFTVYEQVDITPIYL